MFKNYYLKSNQIKLKLFFILMLIYNFLIFELFEQNNQVQLVISDQVQYIENLDIIYEKKSIVPHLLKHNYVTDYFKFGYGDKRKQEVFERAKKCNCFHSTKDIMTGKLNSSKLNETNCKI